MVYIFLVSRGMSLTSYVWVYLFVCVCCIHVYVHTVCAESSLLWSKAGCRRWFCICLCGFYTASVRICADWEVIFCPQTCFAFRTITSETNKKEQNVIVADNGLGDECVNTYKNLLTTKRGTTSHNNTAFSNELIFSIILIFKHKIILNNDIFTSQSYSLTRCV